jgi:hypothetical protein
MFKAALPASTLLDLELPLYEGFQALEAHARYFTNRNSMPTARNQPFHALVDPAGTLRALQPQHLLHSVENQVEYVRRLVDGEEEK